jgi:hypothetical protein
MANTEATKNHTTRCLRCGRTLKASTSVKAGYGRTCAKKIRDAARAEIAAQYKAHLVAKAEELIEQGGLIPLRGQIFLAVSSDGSQTYKTHRAACTCPAGIKAVHVCKHRIAAHLVTAA